MPDVYSAFKKHIISTISYATKWYITLPRVRSRPDLFIAMAVAIVWVYRDHITSDTGDKKLRSQIAQWRQDWVQLVASGRDGDALL
ncbi:hypothetical protein M405DRAFT_822272 [Rhizopogon salebrosus TDB-379]|nr:hypothetical protein M405DRAFT_822272 [Rhizopogon salebrosus TDB-379]